MYLERSSKNCNDATNSVHKSFTFRLDLNKNITQSCQFDKNDEKFLGKIVKYENKWVGTSFLLEL